MKYKNSIIDNWSLEKAATLIEDDPMELSEVDFVDNLGCLSNYINSLLLYEKTSYFSNGFDTGWKEYENFYNSTDIFVKPINLKSNIDWDSDDSYLDHGISNYLISSQEYNSDLFISPYRSDVIANDYRMNKKDNFSKVLDIIDKKS